MKKILLLSLFAFNLCPPVWAQSPLNRNKMPLDAKSVQDFVPAGWQIEAQSSGDLNADGLSDLALQLIQLKPQVKDDEFVNRDRALLILFKRRDGLLHRAALSEKLLQCTSCGGAFYGVVEAPAKIQIVKGILLVSQDYGSRNLVDELYRFRYAPKTGKFMLIGFDIKDHDRLTGQTIEQSTNYLTGQQIETLWQYDPHKDTELKKSTRTKKVPKGQQTLEEMTYENR